MRILLIQSYLGRREKPIYPLGLAYIAANLKEHDVGFIDPNIESSPLDSLRDKVREFQPNLIGVSLRNVDTTQIRDPFIYLTGFKQTLDVLKETVPETAIVVGGAGFSIYARELMRMYPQIDLGVFLEAEESFTELVEKFPEVGKVRGLFLREDGEVIFTGVRDFKEIKDLPFPDWDRIPVAPYKEHLDAIGVQTKRGCGLKCSYCNYPFLNGSCYRYRPPEAVGEEIERLAKDYGVERFIFVDSVFNIPQDHYLAVLSEISRRRLKIKWTGWFNERNLNRELLEKALEAGCEFVSLSPDGFSDRTLKALGKNLHKKDICKVYDLLKEYPQVLVGYNFFFNPPEQTVIDLLKLLWFGLKTKRTFRKRMLGFLLGSIRIEPDTPIYQRALNEGFITEDTKMVVESESELRKLFYRPPKSDALTAMLYLYIGLRKLKHKIIPPPQI